MVTDHPRTAQLTPLLIRGERAPRVFRHLESANETNCISAAVLAGTRVCSWDLQSLRRSDGGLFVSLPESIALTPFDSPELAMMHIDRTDCGWTVLDSEGEVMLRTSGNGPLFEPTREAVEEDCARNGFLALQEPNHYGLPAGTLIACAAD